MTALGASLTSLVQPMRTLLLDFDGPVCSIFAEYPAPLIAAELLHELATLNRGAAEELATASDPLYVLRCAADVLETPDVLALGRKLRDAEVQAVRTAAPTPGAAEVLDAIRDTGRRAVIVSNNSREAVNAYLALHGLTDRVAYVVARQDGMSPRRLKPDRYLLDVALRSSSTASHSALMVGDSLVDVEAARLVGVPVVGFANRETKRILLGEAGAATVVGDMRDLAAAIAGTPVRASS